MILQIKLGNIMEAVFMDREEILAKSRLENVDEGMVMAENKGRKIGKAAFGMVYIVILIFDALKGMESYAPNAMFFAFVAAEEYSRFQFTGKKIHLVVTVLSIIVVLLSLAGVVGIGK